MNAEVWIRGLAADRRRRAALRHLVWIAAVLCGAVGASAAADDEEALRITPPRLALVEGEVSFWRPGAGDWEAAQINVPLAAGDALATQDGQFEVQIGPRAYLRGSAATQVRVKSLEPDFLQLEVSGGRTTLDLRELKDGTVVQIDTPNASMTTARDGYYRVDVSGGATRATVRRGGRATVAPAGGRPVELATGEAVLLEGAGTGQLTIGAASAFDDWDRWCYERADGLLAAPRSYAVSPDIYGVEELERHGTWRYVGTYGRVWVPTALPAGWAPYTYGRWLYDPFYGWAWADYAPWGWAPFHYGRWVYAGYWAWAPGPVLVAPVYSPALVAFFGGPAFSVSIGVPFVSWVALGWGEPLVPWWGPTWFVGRPCWWGWGGPRIVNNIIINNGDTVSAAALREYRNLRVPGGVTSVEKGRFTHPELHKVRLGGVRDQRQLKPITGRPPVEAGERLAGGKAPPRGVGAPSTAAAGAARSFERGAGAAGAGPGAVPPKGGGRHLAYGERLGGRTQTAPLAAAAPRSAPARRVDERYGVPPPLPDKGTATRRYERAGGGAPPPAGKQPLRYGGEQVRRGQAPPAPGRSRLGGPAAPGGVPAGGSARRYGRADLGGAPAPPRPQPQRLAPAPSQSGGTVSSGSGAAAKPSIGSVGRYRSAERAAPAAPSGGAAGRAPAIAAPRLGGGGGSFGPSGGGRGYSLGSGGGGRSGGAPPNLSR